MIFPTLRKLPMGKVMVRTVTEFIDDEMSTYASALAYQMLFSLFPFLLFLIALIGFLHLPDFFSWLRLQSELVLPPEALDQVNPVIDQLQLGARFVTETAANWKSIVDNYMECYHCGPAHPGFSDSVQVDKYTHTLHGNWTLQFGLAKSSEKSFKLDESIKDPSFSGFWAWPCTMFNVPPGANFMTVIYEYPVSAEVTLQHYDIYFLNKELTEEQAKLVEWYRNVFRPEDLNLVESVQRGLKSRGYRGQGRIMVDRERSGISEHGIVHFHRKVAKEYGDD